MTAIRRILAALALAAAAAAAPAADAALAAPQAHATAAASRLARVVSAKGAVVIRTNLAYQGEAAAGTGIVIAPGVVLTNNHVIRGATTIRVVDPRTRRTATASVVGYAIGDDVAVLKLQSATGFASARIGNSATVRRGHVVTAVGNAGGTGTLVFASGRVVALNRAITVQDDQGGSARLRGLIQTNANLQPGDSGGPLLDSAGRVIGMDTAASVNFAFRATGDGYAIPINRAMAIAKQILAGKSSATVHVGPTAFLGISVQTADSFDGSGSAAGALVGSVVAGGPAEQAGLEAGDVITSIDGRTVSSSAAIVPLLQQKKPGDAVQITWIDQLGNQGSGTAKLASGPPQ